MTFLERKELNALSKEVYGASSRWQTLLRKGVNIIESKKNVGRKGKYDTKSKWRPITLEAIKQQMLAIKAASHKVEFDTTAK